METKKQTLNEIVDFVKEALFKAQLIDKPFVLGLLWEHENGPLHTAIRDDVEAFKSLGATEIEWRHDGFRDKKIIAGEELYVSVRGIE